MRVMRYHGMFVNGCGACLKTRSCRGATMIHHCESPPLLKSFFYQPVVLQHNTFVHMPRALCQATVVSPVAAASTGGMDAAWLFFPPTINWMEDSKRKTQGGFPNRVYRMTSQLATCESCKRTVISALMASGAHMNWCSCGFPSVCHVIMIPSR